MYEFDEQSSVFGGFNEHFVQTGYEQFLANFITRLYFFFFLHSRDWVSEL